MALSAGQQGTTTNRELNKLQYAITNIASDITTAATGDKLVMLDASDEYVPKYADGDNVLELMGVTASAAEVIRATDVSTRLVTITADTSITEVLHEGKTCLLGEVGGNAAVAVTLPAATGGGAIYKFIVSVVNTSGYTIQVVGDDIMQGNIIANSTGDTPDLGQPWPTAADSDTITLNGTTTGGVSIGDYVILEDILANTWAVRGVVTASGTEATPFSAAVTP